MTRALIFDFDGLLMDTEVLVFESWRENYEAFGQALSLEEYCGCVGSDFGGFNPKTHLESLVGDTVDWDHWDEVREERAHQLCSELGPMRGVVELLDWARESGVPCAVASSSPRSWVESHLERAGLDGYFALTRCSDDVEQIKPSPELFRSAAEGLETDPAAALVLEDSLNGPSRPGFAASSFRTGSPRTSILREPTGS